MFSRFLVRLPLQVGTAKSNAFLNKLTNLHGDSEAHGAFDTKLIQQFLEYKIRLVKPLGYGLMLYHIIYVLSLPYATDKWVIMGWGIVELLTNVMQYLCSGHDMNFNAVIDYVRNALQILYFFQCLIDKADTFYESDERK